MSLRSRASAPRHYDPDELLRQRGWSIPSADDDENDTAGKGGRAASHRGRATTDGNQNDDVSDDDEPTPQEKAELLASIPTSDPTLDDEAAEALETDPRNRPSTSLPDDHEEEEDKDYDDDDEDLFEEDGEPAPEEEEEEDLFGDGESDDKAEPSGNSGPAPALLRRLSTWAARLFDPQRPRGIIEPPQILPMQDDFLQAFGQREQQKAQQQQQQQQQQQPPIDRHISDSDDEEEEEGHDHTDDHDNDDQNRRKRPGHEDDPPGTAVRKKAPKRPRLESITTNTTEAASSTHPPPSLAGRQLRIGNLKFTTTEATLRAACEQFGPLERFKLMMKDPDQEEAVMNAGRAFVTFTTAEAAQACIQGLTNLDGRPLKITVLSEGEGGPASIKHGGGAGGLPSHRGTEVRYWMQDLSTQCYRCGQVGHKEADCTQAPRAKPCPLCAQTDHGDNLRLCPFKAVCFKCGVPGHISRECLALYVVSYAPSLRILCTLCQETGHAKFQCRHRWNRDRLQAASAPAVCLVCGQKGHYSCQNPQWFFGLEGVYCWNCGRPGHLGQDCLRPTLETCMREEEVARRELQQAAGLDSSRMEPVPPPGIEPRQAPSRGRPEAGRNTSYDDRSRSRSMPPPGPDQRYRDQGSSHMVGSPPRAGFRYHRPR